MANDIIVGLDVGTSTVNTVVLGIEKKQGSAKILGAGKSLSQGIKRGHVSDFNDVASSVRESIKEAERSANMPIKRVHLAFGGIGLGSERSKGVVAVSRADHEISDSDKKRVISQSETNLSNIANKQIIHTVPLGFSIDRGLKTARPVGMKGGKLEVEVLFITCISQHLEDLVKSVEMAGIRVDDVVAGPLAASKVIIGKRQKEVGALMVNFGAGTVSLLVFEDGTPISLEVFPLGSDHITTDIALGLSLSLEEAENLKTSFDFTGVSKKKLAEIIEARLGDIFDLIEAHLKKINRNALLPGGIILTGGGSDLASLVDISKARLKLPATIGNLKEIEGKESLSDSSWSTALGLCFWVAEEEGGPRFDFEFVNKTKNTALHWLRSFLP